MSDAVLVALLLLAFATAVTVHVAIAIALVLRAPRWRGLLALVLPPLAPYWAWREQMRRRAIVWAGAVLLYVIVLVIASR